MLDSIRCEDYGFKLPDLTVAVMVKSYLRWMSPEDAKETLNNIVFSHRSEYKLDGKKLARLIDDAKTAAMMDTAAWQAQEGEHELIDHGKIRAHKCLGPDTGPKAGKVVGHTDQDLRPAG